MTKATSGRIRYEEDGSLTLSGPVRLSQVLKVLEKETQRFLATVALCKRNDSGGYLLTTDRGAKLEGPRILWENIVLLATTASMMALGPTASPSPNGVSLQPNHPTPHNLKTLQEALMQLLFAIPHQSNDTWVECVPAAAIEKIKALAAALELEQELWELSEKLDEAQDDDLRPAKWFDKATDGGLNADSLRAAIKDGRLKKSEKHEGRWFHSVSEVCKIWPDYQGRITQQVETESGNLPG